MVASRGRSSHGVEAGGVGVSAQEIADYYDKHQSVYSRFWSPDALHYGFWFGGTKNLQEATLNTNRFVARALSIRSTDHVLDAGCGVGGSSAYIAETSGARVTGVTLSEVQLDIARKRFAGSVAASRLEILKRNYCSTGFEDGEFSKIFGIESVCHANRKRDFLEEAWRLLSPGGRIAVVDAFLARRRLSPAEQTVYSRSMSGWVVPNLESVGGVLPAPRGMRLRGHRVRRHAAMRCAVRVTDLPVVAPYDSGQPGSRPPELGAGEQICLVSEGSL